MSFELSVESLFWGIRWGPLGSVGVHLGPLGSKRTNVTILGPKMMIFSYFSVHILGNATTSYIHSEIA